MNVYVYDNSNLWRMSTNIDDTNVGTITNIIGCVFDEILDKYAFVDQINNQIVDENQLF